MTESSAGRRRLSAEDTRSHLEVDEQNVQVRKDWTRPSDEHVHALKGLRDLAEETARKLIADFQRPRSLFLSSRELRVPRGSPVHNRQMLEGKAFWRRSTAPWVTARNAVRACGRGL